MSMAHREQDDTSPGQDEHNHDRQSSGLAATGRQRRQSGRYDNGGPNHAAGKRDMAGLLNVRAFSILVLWYMFSAATLFLNKYILSNLGGEPTLLGTSQIIMTTTLGSLQIYFQIGTFRRVEHEGRPQHFWRNMILLGIMRITTVLLGLVSLKFVAVSFTETVKGSAPVFTVVISRLIMREFTGIYTVLSLLPIMAGLVLCSTYELSFNMIGFMAALFTNITDCFQNVFSKRLMSGESYKYTPLELQFYTSLASIAVQLPFEVITSDINNAVNSLDSKLITALVIDGIFFHCQSLTAYILMDYISPVTHSVANTVKRAVLIWSSVLIFDNYVTFLSGLGTVFVTLGVLLYTRARYHEQNWLATRTQYARVTNEV